MTVPSPAASRIGLVDDHEVIAFAIRAAIEDAPGLVLDRVAATVDELLEGGPPVDLAVLDLRLADGSSPAGNVERLMATGCHVLAFTSGENPYLVRAASRTGVLGILRKSEPLENITEALLRAAEGRPVVSSTWAAALDSDPQLREARLSAQEQHILTLFADGNQAKVVARLTGITIGTAEDYVRRIRSKYERVGRPARTKVDLYKRAVEDGFLPLPWQE